MNLTTTDRAAKSIPMTADALVDRLIAIRDELVGGLAVPYVVGGIWKLIAEIEAPAEIELPPISGGAPDDDESDPMEWPAWTDADRWEPNFDGPLPLSVLAESAPTWSPSDQDWNDYGAWCDSQGYGVTEDDLAAAGLAIG